MRNGRVGDVVDVGDVAVVAVVDVENDGDAYMTWLSPFGRWICKCVVSLPVVMVVVVMGNEKKQNKTKLAKRVWWLAPWKVVFCNNGYEKANG